MTTRDLVPGEKYRIKFQDCCVEGWFTGTFLRYVESDGWTPEDDPDEQYRYEFAVFDTGAGNELGIGPLWGAWSFEIVVGSEEWEGWHP